MEYEFKIEYNGQTLDFANGFTIQEISGLDNPEIRISRDELTGLDGGNIWARLYGMLGMAITGNIFGTDVDNFFERKKDLIRAFNKDSDAWFTVTLWNGQSRRIRAKSVIRPVFSIKPGEVTNTTFRLEVVAEDPYWRDTSEQEYTATLAQDSGLEIPFELPAILAQADTSNIITIESEGDGYVYPYIKITGNVNNPRVVNITTGEEFSIDYTIPTGEYVEMYVDTEGKRVLLNGSEKFWDKLEGNFIRIAEGTNQIQFSADTYSAEALLLIRFSNKYESIQ